MLVYEKMTEKPQMSSHKIFIDSEFFMRLNKLKITGFKSNVILNHTALLLQLTDCRSPMAISQVRFFDSEIVLQSYKHLFFHFRYSSIFVISQFPLFLNLENGNKSPFKNQKKKIMKKLISVQNNHGYTLWCVIIKYAYFFMDIKDVHSQIIQF